MKDISFLSIDEVMYIHDLMIKEFGGLAGVRDRQLLESALSQPSLFVFGAYVHKTIFDMAAGLSISYH